MTNLARFENDDIELVIDTNTGEAFASQTGYARMSGLSQQAINKRCNTYNQDDLKTAEIETVKGFKTYNLIPAKIVYRWLMKDNPELAMMMGEVGATVYLHQMAGFKISSSATLALAPNHGGFVLGGRHLDFEARETLTLIPLLLMSLSFD